MLLVACDDLQAPVSFEPFLLVNMPESGGFAALDHDLSFRGHYGDFARLREPIAIHSDREAITFVAGGDRPPELVVFDTQTLRARYREDTAEIEARTDVGPVTIHGSLGIAVLDDESVVLDGRHAAIGDGVLRLAGDPYAPVAFAGPFFLQADAMARLGSSIFIVASRVEDGPRFLFELDGTSLMLLDSIAASGARQVVSSPDGHHLYLSGPDIRKFDTVTGGFVASGASPAVTLHSRIVVSRDGETVYLRDPGDFFDYPGPGVIYRWTADLDPMIAVDLRDYSSGVAPPVVAGLATNASGDTLFVGIGTRSRGPLYGPQKAELLVLINESGSALERVDLEGWGPSRVVPLF